MTWQIDSVHSHIYFTVRHMMISKVRGAFEKFEGNIAFDEEDPTNSQVAVQIEAASINTNTADRDNHLRSPDFLNAEKYPYLTFKSNRIEKTGENSGRLVGDLTIRGVTKEVVLDVTYAGQIQNPWGQTSAGFSANGSFNRKDWGLNWNQALEAGGVLVGDEIKVEIELELIKQAEAVPA